MSDLIKREAAIEVIKGNNYGYPGDYTEVNGNAAIDDMMSLPSAERKGEWIEHRPPTNDYCGMVECPFCGEELVGEPTDFNFCPNCGAKMEGAEDE